MIQINKIIEFCKNHIFGIILISYFIIISGAIYNLINEPPATGAVMGPDGKLRAQSIMKGRQNGQYSLEGFTAGLFIIMIGGGMVMIDMGFHKNKAELTRNIFLYTGAGLTGLGMLLISLYSHIKFN